MIRDYASDRVGVHPTAQMWDDAVEFRVGNSSFDHRWLVLAKNLHNAVEAAPGYLLDKFFFFPPIDARVLFQMDVIKRPLQGYSAASAAG